MRRYQPYSLWCPTHWLFPAVSFAAAAALSSCIDQDARKAVASAAPPPAPWLPEDTSRLTSDRLVVPVSAGNLAQGSLRRLPIPLAYGGRTRHGGWAGDALQRHLPSPHRPDALPSLRFCGLFCVWIALGRYTHYPILSVTRLSAFLIDQTRF
jgi:hypothetical protein